jgi:hypothetical protein
MAMTPEGRVKAAIKGYLRNLQSCWFFFPAAHGYGVNGIPDIVGCYKGFFFAIECKAPGKIKMTTPLQKMQIAEINGAQGWAIVADDVSKVHELIRLIDISMAVPA